MKHLIILYAGLKILIPPILIGLGAAAVTLAVLKMFGVGAALCLMIFSWFMVFAYLIGRARIDGRI